MNALTTPTRPRSVTLLAIAAVAVLLVLGTALVAVGFCWSAGSPSAASTSAWTSDTAHGVDCARC